MRLAFLAALLLVAPATLAAAPVAPALATTVSPECALLPANYAPVCVVAVHAAEVLCEVLFFWFPTIPATCVSVA